MIALTVFPLAFPQMTRLATGLAPTDPRFRRKRLRFLRWLGERLSPNAGPADAKSPSRPTSGVPRTHGPRPIGRTSIGAKNRRNSKKIG
jgi:hypothetical protein